MRTVPATVLTLALLTGCGSGSDVGTLTQPSPSPSGSAVPTPTPTTIGTPSATPGAQSARAVYWIGRAQDPLGPRLYREFVARPDAAEPVRDAVEVMLAGEPRDPDYTSLWADGTTVRGVRKEGATAVVDLSQQARTNGGGSAFEAATVQQLVHTVTAADPELTAVRLLVEGEPIETLWGSVGTDRPLTRGPSAEVLGPVWLDLPDGGTLDGQFGGTATVFEATVSWQLRQGDRVVREGFSTATIGAPGRGEWTATVSAPAGNYELWAFESSAQDGRMVNLDSKRVTITG
jgi:hypothetical protein